MYAHYFYWQYIVAPLFLLRFGWNLQRLLLQLFSVRPMLTTLFAHWHKDRVILRQGSLSGILRAAAMNAISRTIGFLVRSSILLVWAVSASIFLVVASGLFVAFVMAPLAAAAAIAYGITLLLGGV